MTSLLLSHWASLRCQVLYKDPQVQRTKSITLYLQSTYCLCLGYTYKNRNWPAVSLTLWLFIMKIISLLRRVKNPYLAAIHCFQVWEQSKLFIDSPEPSDWGWGSTESLKWRTYLATLQSGGSQEWNMCYRLIPCQWFIKAPPIMFFFLSRYAHKLQLFDNHRQFFAKYEENQFLKFINVAHRNRSAS